MREAIGGAWLTQIVVFFVLLFAGYLAMSINISKAYKVKNEVIDIIERQNGISGSATSGSIQTINAYLDKTGYKTSGRCGSNDATDTGWYGLNQRGEFVPADGVSKYYMCAKKITVYDESQAKEVPYSVYFRIKVFYNLDIPIFGSLFNMGIAGDTTTIFYPNSVIR